MHSVKERTGDVVTCASTMACLAGAVARLVSRDEGRADVGEVSLSLRSQDGVARDAPDNASDPLNFLAGLWIGEGLFRPRAAHQQRRRSGRQAFGYHRRTVVR